MMLLFNFSVPLASSKRRTIKIIVPQLNQSFSLETLSSRKIKECYTEVLQETRYNTYQPTPDGKKKACI